jgi:hypothetical protein
MATAIKPFKTYAQLIERHWDGIAMYCKPENKVSLDSWKD